MELFCYGTLLDGDVRRIVVPHLDGRLEEGPATLPHHRRVRASHADLPVLVRARGQRVPGRLVSGIDLRGLSRIAAFEGKLYRLQPVAVLRPAGQAATAWAFLPAARQHVSERTWSLEQWQRRTKPRYLARVRGWMGEFGTDTLMNEEIGWRLRRQIRRLADIEGRSTR